MLVVDAKTAHQDYWLEFGQCFSGRASLKPSPSSGDGVEASKIAIGPAREPVIVDARIRKATKIRIVAVLEEVVADKTNNKRNETIRTVAERSQTPN
jgi:hypothetical protein